MHLSDEIRHLQELHASGVLTEAEFARAKAKVLTDGGTASPPLAVLRFESELARIDREWSQEQESFRVTGRHGRQRLPQEGQGMATIFLGGGMALLWTVLAFALGAPALFPLLGIAGIVGAVCIGAQETEKAAQYQQALRRYQERRAAFIARRPR